jgi:hypothetical protein
VYVCKALIFCTAIEMARDGLEISKHHRDIVSQDEKEKDGVEEGSQDPELGSKREKALVRKLDLHLIPLVMLLYLFSFLDRHVSSRFATSAFS